ncbi:MAG: hypothetical protein JWL61_870 [Gemmatimonadetes bacterium]|nr:hypothetical protein [Gemmatimonadota bacterium]
MSTADVTSGADLLPRVVRDTVHFGTIIVVGGGCYGSYYVRQLGRAAKANAAKWTALVVVDRDAHCRVATLPAEERPPGLRVEIAEWGEYFGRYLTDATQHAAETIDDAIVPSPLMPHLMAEWLLARARDRWPQRRVAVEPLASAPTVPWQRAGTDGTHYVSFAEWMCPINCIEPPRCPATKDTRSWSLPPALAQYAADERAADREVEGPYVFHCSHRTHGVGMIDVRDVIAADAAIAERAERGEAAFLVGTASHCHGALQRIVVGP